MRRPHLLIALFIFLLFLPASCFAVNTVSGIVKDCSGNPVPGVTVKLAVVSYGNSCPGNTSDYGCTSSDASGSYTLTFDPPSFHAYVYVIGEPYIRSNFYYCTNCTMPRCCNGYKPSAYTCGTPLDVAANMDNRYYPKDLPLDYSAGSCDVSDGSVTLSSTDCSSSSVTLFWAVPSDSGCRVQAYDIRYSTSQITSANWDSATQVSGEPTPGEVGDSDQMTVSNLSTCTWYYFAIKAQRRNGSWSPLSNNLHARTKCPPNPACATGD